MNGSTRLVLGAVAVMAVALGGLVLFNVAGGSVGTPGPTPSPTASPRPFPTDTSGGIPVEPGRYALVLPAPAPGEAAVRVVFTMPAGWEKNLTPTTLWHAEDHRRIGFFTVDNLYNDPCQPSAGVMEPPLGPTVDDLVGRLQASAGLTSSTPSSVTLGGGTGVDFTLTAKGDTTACADELQILWTAPQGAPVTDGGAALSGNESGRILVLDAGGARVAITRAYDASHSEADLAEMQAIVDSVRIERGPIAPASPLEGTWVTAPSTCADQNAALADAGFTAEQLDLGGWDAATCHGMDYGSVHSVRFEGARITEYEGDTTGWAGTYEVVDDTTIRARGGVGTITYRFAVDGNQLVIDMIQLSLTGKTEADVWADRIAQTVIYESLPFTRQASTN